MIKIGIKKTLNKALKILIIIYFTFLIRNHYFYTKFDLKYAT